MSAELIYRTTSPAALAWRRAYLDSYVAAKRQWDDFETEVEVAIGIPAGEQHRSLYVLHGAIIGVVRTSDEWADRKNYSTRFPGWKEHQRFPILVPRLNTRTGKEWQAKLDALPVLDLRAEARHIGVPGYVFVDHHAFSAGIDFDMDGDEVVAIYQTWGSGRCAEQVLTEQAKHSEIDWLEVPRSQWYAREEARSQL